MPIEWAKARIVGALERAALRYNARGADQAPTTPTRPAVGIGVMDSISTLQAFPPRRLWERHPSPGSVPSLDWTAEFVHPVNVLLLDDRP